MRREIDTPGLATADGARHLLLARRHRIDVAGITIAPARLSPAAHALVAQFRRGGVPVQNGEAPHGIQFSFRPRWSKLHRAGGLWLALDDVRSPGNLGTMLRTAAAAGVAGVVFTGDADPWEQTTVRSSMGAVFALRLVRATPDHLRRWMKRTGARGIGTSSQSDHSYARVSYRGDVVVMMGHERRGLSDLQRRMCHRVVAIPMACEGSLNVASAAAVVLFEANRQRSGPRTIR